jgi:hypothetical protein
MGDVAYGNLFNLVSAARDGLGFFVCVSKGAKQ